MNNLLPIPNIVKVGLILIPVTTGRIGNAIVTEVRNQDSFMVVTDFGNEIGPLNRMELEQFWGVPDWYTDQLRFREQLQDIFPDAVPAEHKADEDQIALLERFHKQRELIDYQIQKIEQPEPA